MKILIVKTNKGFKASSINNPIECMDLLVDNHPKYYDKVVKEKNLDDVDIILFSKYLENFISDEEGIYLKDLKTD